MSIILEVKKLSKEFGGLKALDNVDFIVNENEILSIIGPNGAGKTTCFNCIFGISRATYGNIYFYNNKNKYNITNMRTDNIARRSIARTFQNIRLFPNLTVLDNILIGQHIHVKSNFIDIIFNLKFHDEEEKIFIDNSLKYINFLELKIDINEYTCNLPYGIQKRLEIARALVLEPRLLLLDEPAAGLNIQETQKLMQLIQKIRNSGITVILIEHDMKMVMNISDRIIVLDYGEKIAEGHPEEIQKNSKVIEAYLGELGEDFLDA